MDPGDDNNISQTHKGMTIQLIWNLVSSELKIMRDTKNKQDMQVKIFNITVLLGIKLLVEK